MGPVKLMTNKKFYASTLMLIVLTVSGCAGKTIYQWGDYETLLYKRFVKPGSVPISQEIEQLSDQLAETIAKNQLVPPGVCAHLGYLHLSNGDVDMALIYFQNEKKRFPESSHFIDGLIKRLKK